MNIRQEGCIFGHFCGLDFCSGCSKSGVTSSLPQPVKVPVFKAFFFFFFFFLLRDQGLEQHTYKFTKGKSNKENKKNPRKN